MIFMSGFPFAVEIDSLLIGLAMPIAVALIVGAVAFAKRRNHENSAGAIDPESVRAGRVPVSFWTEKFQEVLKVQELILKHQALILQHLVEIKAILMSRIELREND